ncbi:probable glutamate receptor [Panulirus ornatus]|uniref:probable glutamate receptor n=1 Tax=Panulirus ornatus TaxID=150431 RepID=UPI003A8BCE18
MVASGSSVLLLLAGAAFLVVAQLPITHGEMGDSAMVDHTVMGGLQVTSGVTVFKVSVYNQDTNATQAELQRVVHEAKRLRQLSWCMTVVVMSDDPAFLAAFAHWSHKDGVLLWSTKLLAVTRLSLPQLQDLKKTFSMTNAMLLIINNSLKTLRYGIYTYLPYTPRDAKALRVASWTPHQGVILTAHLPLFHDKFSKFTHHPTLVVASEEFPTQKAWMVDDPDAPGGKRLTFTGPVSNVLDHFAKTIGFSFTFKRPPDGSWGYERPDGSFSGMVGMLLRDEAVIGLGPFAYSAARSKVIDYTRPMLIDYIRIMGGRGRPEVDPWGFLLPLTPLVWAAILTTLLVPVGVIFVLSYPMLETGKKEKTDIFFGYLRILLQQDYSVSVEWLWKRLVVGVWMMMTVVLTRSYAGNLMSLLAVRHIPQPYQTLRDLLDDPSATMIWEANSIYMKFCHLAESGTFREVADLDNKGLIEYRKTTEFSHAVDTLVRGGDHVLVVEALTLVFRLAQDFSNKGRCDFYLSKEVFLPFMFCMIGQKKSPLVPVISKRIMTMTEGGLYDHWMKAAVPNSTSCLRPPTKITVQTTLALANLWGMFVVLVGGHTTGLLLLCLEVFSSRLLQS